MKKETNITQISLKSIKKGPVVWLTGVIHGDEHGGKVIIENVFKKIKRSGLIKGELYAFPLINKEGFKKDLRLIPQTKEDLNRCFPGNKKGSLGKRMAYIISKKIMKTKPSLVIDLHNDWKNSICYVVIDPIRSKELKNKVEKIAKNTGVVCVREKNLKYNYNSTLSGHFISKNIKSLTIEMGGNSKKKNIEIGTKVVFNILMDLGMVKKMKKYVNNKKLKNQIFDYFEESKISKKGGIEFLVKPGDFVKKGTKIIKIYNEKNKKQFYIFKAKESGVVLGYEDLNIIKPGMPMIAFGVSKTL